MTLPHIFSASGEAALRSLLRGVPLMAFDFDGTIAPIVARPQAARVPAAVAWRLRELALRFPVAIVTGRAVADVRERLGFEPHFVVGNHGAEDAANADEQAAWARQLNPLRDALRIQHAELSSAGVSVEDKGLSMALHYRLAVDRRTALAVVGDVLRPLADTLKVFPGKMVINVAPVGSPDKAQAVQALVQRAAASAAFYAGDDVNDEPVFAAAPPHWLTLRVGRDDRHTQARFCIEGPQEMALLLDRILDRASTNLGS